MGFWSWFRPQSKAKAGRPKGKKPLDRQVAAAFGRVKHDIKKLRAVVAETSSRIDTNSQVIATHAKALQDHTSRLSRLEEIVIAAPLTEQRQECPTSRPRQSTNRLVATRPPEAEPAARLDMSSLSQQEKKIIGVFLANRHMALSYLDVAKSLGKSPHTVKNQIRQLNIKASLLDKTVDADNKNRFRLKKQLKIETDLNAD